MSALYLVLATAVEVILLVILACVLCRKSLRKEFPAYYAYLWVEAISSASYVILRSLALMSILPLRTAAVSYSYFSTALYFVEAALIFYIVRDLYREATHRIQGIQRLGDMVFYWAVVISAVLAMVAGLTPHSNYATLLAAVSYQINRSESILVLCLLVFLAFAAQKLGITYGSRVFGICFGFAMLATEQMVVDALVMRFGQSWLVVNFYGELVQVAAISLWVVYFLKAEPERKLVTVPIDSPLIQWNEVARLLGNPSGQVVVSAPATFMPEVRDVPAVAATGTSNRQGFGVVS